MWGKEGPGGGVKANRAMRAESGDKEGQREKDGQSGRLGVKREKD